MSIISYENKLYSNFIDINEISWKKIKNNKVFAIKVDMNKIEKNKHKQLIKKILKLRRKTLKNKNVKNDINGIAVNINNFDINNENQKEIVESLTAILKDNDKLMYEYIYDNVCNYLDECFYGKNLCNFKNNKCGEKINTTSNVGCCRHYKNMFWGPLKLNNKLVQCEYLKDYKCSAKCLPCKLFTCDYLEKRGIKFKINDIFLLDTFLNIIQKIIIKVAVYTPKEKIIKKLLLFRTKI